MPSPGQTLTPGAQWDAEQVRFVLQAAEATRVEVSLFDDFDSALASSSHALQPGPGGLWEAVIAGLSPGQLYGYRVDGPWDPARGLRFNPAKLLIDPMAAAICGPLIWHDSLGDHDHQSGDTAPSHADSARFLPKSVVVDRSFDWQGDRPPAVPWTETLIYECHVKGMTRLHPAVPPEYRGRYLGLCHEATIEHFQSLGVTTVELLPVQHFVSEKHLAQLGLTNYFGYNPIGWIAPHSAYATSDRGDQVREFKTMVRTLHEAGLEVVLDVVFNHTAEGNEFGPSLSHRGLDNRGFYRLRGANRRHYENFSGCGNTVDFSQPLVVAGVLACLRYWVSEMHVDGFRFDLAAILGRQDDSGFSSSASFFEQIEEDPVLSQVKLIAEPWDVGPGGYQLGRFPAPWREWNDRYRDAMRSFWRGDSGLIGEVVQRLAGSPDIFQEPDLGRSRSLNFITSHDGFTLLDLVSYEHRHNRANGEENRDGHQHNLSRNWGVEGPTDSVEIVEIRLQMMRNFLATLLLTQAPPRLSHGDELARTQMGNNNPSCQDSPLTWVHWETLPYQRELLEFVRQISAIRKELDLGKCQAGSWLSAHADDLGPAARSMARSAPFAWLRAHPRCHTLTVFNADDRGHLCELPGIDSSRPWRLLVNTARPGQRNLRGQAVRVPARSLLLLQLDG